MASCELLRFFSWNTILARGVIHSHAYAPLRRSSVSMDNSALRLLAKCAVSTHTVQFQRTVCNFARTTTELYLRNENMRFL